MLIGNVLVALPLLAAASYAAYNLDVMVEQSEGNLRQSTSLGRLGRALPENLEEMARSLKQYQVLHDPTLLQDYDNLRQEFQANSHQLATLPLFKQLAPQITPLLDRETAAFNHLRREPQAQAVTELLATLDDLDLHYHRLLDQSEQLLDRERESYRNHLTLLRQQLLISQSLAIFITIGLLWFGRRLLARLWNRFEYAVWSLGKGRLLTQISISGPDDMQRVGRRLEWLRSRLLALEEQRTLGLRHLSHELKTPLAVLREGASLLQEGAVGALNDKQKKIIDIMHSNVLRQQELIDGLLKLQQIGGGNHLLQKTTVALEPLVHQALSALQLVARSKQLRMIGTMAPVEVYGGREELLTIISNLLSNTVKFSPPGEVFYFSVSQDEHDAIIDIADNGPGISDEDREKIFEPFYRSRSAVDISGTGLGLAVAYQFALAHNGNIELVKAADFGLRGAAFRVTLPRQRGSA